MQGADLSYWQGAVDWSVMASKAGFVYIKASDGGYPDRNFKVNWAGAQKSGIPRGAYHFYHPDVKWQGQRWQFLSQIGDDPGDLPWAIDIEVGAWSDDNLTDLKLFMEALTADASTHELARPIIYTGDWYWTPHIGLRAWWASSYDLWVASYTKTPVIPAPWLTYKLWQYRGDGDGAGKAYGVQSADIDLDVSSP